MHLQQSLYLACPTQRNAKFIDLDAAQVEASQSQKSGKLFHCIFQKHLCCIFPAASNQGDQEDMRLPASVGDTTPAFRMPPNAKSVRSALRETHDCEKQLRTFLAHTEIIKKDKEFNQPKHAIQELLELKLKLNEFRDSELETGTSSITALNRLVQMNIARGLMNAYRFEAIHHIGTSDDQKLMQVAAFHHAMALEAMLPAELEDVLCWLQYADHINPKDFYAILCNDLGKFLKDMDSLSLDKLTSAERYVKAIGLFKTAIATAPEYSPAGIFAREACVDAMIKLRIEEHPSLRSSPWPALFMTGEKTQMCSWLRQVVEQSKLLKSTHWEAYKSSQIKLRQLSSGVFTS